VPQCPACGEQNPEGSRYCSACGTALTVEPAAEERKIVSVLFVDLVDFTSRSDQADPEDVRAMLVPYHTRVKSEIESFGGVVEKFIGDAVMAVFGAPVSHGDDAERAVRAGLRVLDAIQELNKENPGLDLTVRAAVNTGEAIVDARQQPDIAQGLAHGDVVNTASRLQTGAPAGRLVVGEETYRATRSVIGYGLLEPMQAKGKRKPLAAWLALEALTAPAERAASAAPMVGRNRELELLRRTWEGVTTDRSPDLVTVIGPPGIGKTRQAPVAVGLAVVEGQLGVGHDQRPAVVPGRLLEPVGQRAADPPPALGYVDVQLEPGLARLSSRNDHSTALPTIRSPSYTANSSWRSPLSGERKAPRNSSKPQNGACSRPNNSARWLSSQ
jgi:class 3 adenylate cyclase